MLKHDRPRTKKNCCCIFLEGATHSSETCKKMFSSHFTHSIFFLFAHSTVAHTKQWKIPHTNSPFSILRKTTVSPFQNQFFLLVRFFFVPSFPLRLFITADSRWRGEKFLGAKHRYVKVKTFMPSFIWEHNLLEKEAFSGNLLTEGRRQIKLEFTKNAFLTRTFLTHSLLLFFSKIFLFVPLSLKRLWGRRWRPSLSFPQFFATESRHIQEARNYKKNL